MFALSYGRRKVYMSTYVLIYISTLTAANKVKLGAYPSISAITGSSTNALNQMDMHKIDGWMDGWMDVTPNDNNTK